MNTNEERIGCYDSYQGNLSTDSYPHIFFHDYINISAITRFSPWIINVVLVLHLNFYTRFIIILSKHMSMIKSWTTLNSWYEHSQFSSVQFSHSVMSDSLRPHESQHARPPCPSQTPGVYSNSCPSSRWCHPPISSSVILFSSCPQSLSASGSFSMSQLFAWGGQSIGVSASASVLPMNTQDWSLGWTGWISLRSKGLSRIFPNTTVQKHQFFSHLLLLILIISGI